MMTRLFVGIGIAAILICPLSGCWLALAGAGAEGGYVVAQEDRTAGETLDDQRITASIKTKLLADSDVSGLDVNVDTFKGSVTLRGVVRSEHEAEKAYALAQSVSGVKGVTSKLHVD